MIFRALLLPVLLALGLAACDDDQGTADQQNPDQLIIITTTSVRDSGLAAQLFPAFERDSDYAIRLIVVPTGQAFAIAARGDADGLLVHDPAGEQAFVESGLGRDRRTIFQSRFVLAGPLDDPADVGGVKQAAEGLDRIRASGVGFVSRGDDSGTHRRELALWQKTVAGAPQPGDGFYGSAYKSIGAGQGAALNLAAGLGAYVLTDRASFLAFGNAASLTAFPMDDDPLLNNPYSFIIAVKGQNTDGAERLGDWLVGDRAGALITGFQVVGQHPFRSAVQAPFQSQK